MEAWFGMFSTLKCGTLVLSISHASGGGVIETRTDGLVRGIIARLASRPSFILTTLDFSAGW
jgi:hypothetical protein